MLWYEIPMLCYKISMLCCAMVNVVKDMLDRMYSVILEKNNSQESQSFPNIPKKIQIQIKFCKLSCMYIKFEIGLKIFCELKLAKLIHKTRII